MDVDRLGSRKTRLITISWFGIILAGSGVWLVLGPGFALFILGVFITVVALVSLDAELKNKNKNKKNEKV